jgi:ADP-ribose pyrophosphatase YjhB (NUDIX family)
VSTGTKKGRKPDRVDYWDDRDAPVPTSRRPSASVVVRDYQGRVLLLRRSDSGRWTIPTGGLKKNETLTGCAMRECREETGLDIEIVRLAGLFSDPRHVIAYADGEVRQPVNACFEARPVGGELKINDESTEVMWASPAELDGLDIHPSIRRRIAHGLGGGTVPYVD